MTTDDRVNEYYKWVLGRIKEELETTPSSKPLRYELSHVAAAGVPNNETEANIIGRLEELKAIKIINEIPRTWEYSHHGIFELKVLQPKFDEIYQKYENLNNPEPQKTETTKLVKVTSKRDQSERFWQLLGHLSRQHDSFVNSPEREFFLGTADYIKFIVETPELDEIAKLVKAQEAEDEKKISKLEQLVREETEKTAKELEELMVKEHFEGMKLAVEFQSYYGIKEGRIQSSATLEEALWGQVTGILRAIDSSGHRNLLDKYIKTSPDIEGILEYTFSEHYNEYEEELKRFRDLRKTTVWGSWDSLALVYLAVHKFDEELKGLDPEKDVWKRMNFIGLHGEMQDILNHKEHPRYQFILEEYKTHLNRVHQFFTKQLEDAIPVLQIVKDVREEAAKTLSSFVFPQIQFPIVQIPEAFLKGVAGTAQLTDNLVKAQQSFSALGAAVQSVQQSFPDFTKVAKSVQFGSTLIEQLNQQVNQSNKLLTNIPAPKSFTDPGYHEKAEAAEDQKIRIDELEDKVKKLEEQLGKKLSKKMTKTRAVKEINKLVKFRNFGKKEKKFLTLLADLDKKGIKYLAGVIETDDCKHIKGEVHKKLDGTDWAIKTFKATGLDNDSFYQLIFLPDLQSDKDS